MRPTGISALWLCGLYLCSALLLGPHQLHWTSMLLAAPLVWLSVTDLRARIIPDTASAMVAAFGVIERAEHPLALIASLMVSGLVIMSLALVGAAYWKRRGIEALGLGDVKLIGAGILVVGIQNMWFMLLLASVGGIIAALLLSLHENEGVPFGPFLAYSIYTTFLLTGPQ